MTGVLYRIAHFCVRRRFIVVGVWFVVAVALVGVSQQMGDNTNDNLSLPGTNSQSATDTLQKPFPAQANGTSPIVLHAPKRQADRFQVRQRGQQGRRRRGQGARSRFGDQPADPAGRRRAQQGQVHRIPHGRTQGQPRLAVCQDAQTIIDRQPTRPRRPGLRCRPAVSSGRRCQSPRPSPASWSGSSPRW